MRVQNTPPEIKKVTSMESLMQENLKATQETLKEVKKVGRYIFWQRVMGWTKFVLILIPLALAVIYLPGYIRKAYDLYRQVLSPFAAQTGGTLKNLEGLIKQLQGFSNVTSQMNSDKINQDILDKFRK